MIDAGERPLAILIAALGGEGGGVLSNWLVDAALAEGYPVQSTSIPGVAQRTGATTYYLEIFPARFADLGGRQPVLALTPNPGNIDLMVASELVEAGRAMQNGYVSPDRTTLVAATHRIYAVVEKAAMGDGRYDDQPVLQAAKELAKHPVLFDVAEVARANGCQINAVLFGAMAGSGVLPLRRAAFEAAIRGSEKAVEANLRGFAAGFAEATGEAKAPPAAAPEKRRTERMDARVRRVFPPETHRILEEGVARLIDYQNEAYAARYLDRLEPILALERNAGGAGNLYKLTGETGRHLALWMSYEDVIRVADLKSRPERLQRVRAEVGARPGQPVAVVEFLKPGIDEVCSILPGFLAKPILALAERRGWRDRLNVGLHVNTTSVTGFLLLRLLARLRSWRPHGWRFAEEQRLIERWLAAIRAAAPKSLPLALETAECARLVKGYGDTHRRGTANFLRIFSALVEGGVATGREPESAAAAIRRAREAALADPDGKSLDQVLAEVTAVNERPRVGLSAAASIAAPAGD